MLRRHRAEDHEEHENHERWLVSFADMMTLLMATFLMMYSISVLDLKKFETFQQAFTQGVGKNTHQLPSEGAPPEGEPRDVPIGAKDGTPDPSPAPIPPSTGEVLAREDLDELRTQVEAAVAAAGLQSEVQVAMDPRGLVLYVTSGVLFAPGEGRLSPTGLRLLHDLGPVLISIGNDLVIEGHTDSRPISTPEYPTNWELSTARATAVLRDLLAAGVTAPRLSAAGYADTRPRDSGTDEEALARNRRVDIVVEAPPEAATAPPAAPPAAQPASAPAAPEPAHEGGH